MYAVETALLANLSEDSSALDGYPFQVCYEEAAQVYTLYLISAREQDRADWITAIRAGTFENSRLQMYIYT